MSRKWNAVADFLQHRRLPAGLARKVREYYSYVLEKELHSDEATIIAGLSATLKEQVVLHLYREAVERVPVFRQKGSQFIAEVVTCLKCEYYTPVRPAPDPRATNSSQTNSDAHLNAHVTHSHVSVMQHLHGVWLEGVGE
jgi:hypothetical protein